MIMIMKRVNRLLLISLALLAAASCLNKPKVSVNADFTTDKDVYEIYEDISFKKTCFGRKTNCGERSGSMIS